MSKVRIGVGKTGYHSYWLKAYNDEAGLVWEGMVYARPQTAPDGSAGLNVERVPGGLHQAYQKYGTLRTEWEPMWEEVVPEQLPTSTSGSEGYDG